MIINAFMKKFGFGYTGARQLVLERDGKLVMTFAPEGGASFMPSVGGAGGGLEIALVRDGQPVDYKYTATQSLIELAAEGGGAARISYDAGANALRIEGEGASLRLAAGGASMGVTSLNTPQGVELSMGGGKYLFTAPRGTISFDDTWLLGQFHSVTPVLDLAPDGGAFELVAYDLAADAPAPEITKTPAQCAEASEAGFKAFCGRLVPLPEQFGDVRESIAYLLWLNRRILPDGGAAIVGNRALSPDTDARWQAIASLAFADPDEAVGLILALEPAAPPIQAIAVLRLLDGGLLARASRETVYKLFNALNASARRWLGGRSTADGRRAFYAYRYETGIERPGVFGEDDGPISSPDLYAYLALTCEALSRLADIVLDGGEVHKWRERSRSYTAALTGELWDGEKFTGINAYTGERTGGDPLLGFMPLVLGGRLPAGITDKLAADIDGAALRSAMGTLAVMGLYDAGRGELAARLAAQALEDARANGVECPFYGAALLALAAKVL